MGHPLTSKICPVCGKRFIKAALSVYHTQYKGRTYQCCSYTCYNIVMTMKEDAKREKKNHSK